jgi:tetratricopeptide (TPR) repeat protein
MADTVHNLAVTAANSGEFDQAIARYLQALDLKRRAGDRRGTAVESYSLGVLYEYQGRYGAAIKSHEEAVKILRETKESGFWLGAILGQYGRALSQAGRSADADKILNEALAAARQVGNHAVIAQNLNFRGDAFFYRGEWKQARTFYQQALQTATAGSDRRFTLISRINLAKVATKEVRPSEAVASFSQLAADVDALGLRYLAVESTIYLAEALLKKGDRDRAQGVLEDALSRSERLGAQALLARSHHLLAATFAQAGNEAESRRHDEQARRILQEIQQESKSEAVVKRADLAPILQSPAH